MIDDTRNIPQQLDDIEHAIRDLTRVVLYIGRHTGSFPRVTDPEGQPMPPLEALKITAERLGRIEDHPDFEKTIVEAARKTCERTAE